jgi:mono/diheme cytochrome c family protein
LSSSSGPSTSADGGGQADSQGIVSVDSGKADATTIADASGTDGQSEANIEDGGALDSPAESDAADTTPPTPPTLLSKTGLFTSVASDGGLVLASGVQEYVPLYPLWADGAQKVRWIYLPPGSKIDTTNPDLWSFPAGTKFWKEFDLDGKRLETRLVWKWGPSDDDVLYTTYWWDPEAGIPNDAENVFVGDGGTSLIGSILETQNVNGTTHDIPSLSECGKCHDSLQRHVLGFGAMELNHNMPGVNINTLVDAGLLTANPALADLEIPGDATAQAALGYLHGNCGNCHNNTPGPNAADVPPMYLRVLVGTKTVQATDTYTTAVNQLATDFMVSFVDGGTSAAYRIAGGDPAQSVIIYTMNQRNNSRYEMPPVASNFVDDAGVAAISKWIATLPPPP